ncbi:NUC189-domain-containing protein [Xylariomycetidae sp. FL2044]|nr:NUC189-domain-containing protein [Xylariomycetidae sp. FL2044]
MSTKRKLPSKIAHPVVKQSAKHLYKTSINESDTAVSVPGIAKSVDGKLDAVIEISSDSGSSDYELSDEEPSNEQSEKPSDEITHDQAEEQPISTSESAASRSRENGNGDVDMLSPNIPNDPESDQEPTQPTFGELAHASDTIDVPSTLAVQSNSVVASGRSLAPPSLSSLGTVLTQALRTDDTDLLESCLHTTDITTIRNTIERLDSTLAGALLSKLAARMHRRPGRAGSLITWVQWTLVAHGGALATQPGLAKKLGELHRVLEERSRGLNPLLALKGKLDLLEAQMELRRRMHQNVDVDEDAHEDGGVIYVEGEGSDVDVTNGLTEVDDDDVPVTNGVVEDDSEEDDEESSDDEGDLEELEGEDDLDENDVNHEDVDSDEEDSEPEAVPAKRSRRR